MSTDLSTARQPRRATAGVPHFVFHPSFEEERAEEVFTREEKTVQEAPDVGYMIDEVTRAITKQMHYAAWRWHRAERAAAIRAWRQRYFHLRDEVVLGNRKLVYRAVGKRFPGGNHSEDLISDCQIVLIQAVAAFNPWLGIRFSTYAFTCLMRALARLSHKQAADLLARSASLDKVPHFEPGVAEVDRSSPQSLHVDELLRDCNPLLSQREKTVIRRRFCLNEQVRTGTLEQVGRELGLSKERVRQVQATALDKLRKALLAGPASR